MWTRSAPASRSRSRSSVVPRRSNSTTRRSKSSRPLYRLSLGGAPMRRYAFIALLMLWMTGPAFAADPPLIPMSPELRKFLSDPDEEKIVKAQALHDWNNTVLGCATPPALDAANVVIGMAPKFDKAGKPVSGNWRVITRLSACDQARNFSLLYAFAANGQLVRLGMLPGSSAADPILQRDAFLYANLAMGKLTPPGCKDFKYLDTAFEAFG